MLKREPFLLAQRPSRAWAVLAETLLSGFLVIAIRTSVSRERLNALRSGIRLALRSTSPRGISAKHFSVGIVEEMKAKTKHPPAGGFAASMLVSGEVDLVYPAVSHQNFNTAQAEHDSILHRLGHPGIENISAREHEEGART